MFSPTLASAGIGASENRRRCCGFSGSSNVLMYAAQQGHLEKVQQIITNQPNLLTERDRTGKTPLHYACGSTKKQSAHIADCILMAAPELVEGKDEDGFTPLHLAVIAGNMSLVTFLLANNADVNAVDNEKHTVVHWATVCGETEALRAVLAAGASISTPDVHKGYPLHYAAQMCGGHERDANLGFNVLQTLLNHHEIDVNVEDGDGRQPLLWAASAGSSKAVLALIRAGSPVETSDKDGLTALHCAASRGHTEVLDSLLTLCGASPDVIDSNGCTALHYSVTLGHADATALLLAHGADPNRQDRKGRSPAHCGCSKGQFETVKMISGHGANLWLKNARGDLPLHEAAASGRRDLVKWLLAMRPSQVNARNNDGRCPLHLAALNDNADMCKILLDAGALINPVLRTSKNAFMTPLDCALRRGFRSTAKYLQLHGGLPASRLGSGNNQQNASASVGLQIRDDITFWGESSSDESEQDEFKRSRSNQRKKMLQKYERKRTSASGSEVDGTRMKHNKKKYPKSSNSSMEFSKSGSRIDYTNEITINGNTEINIHQSREISVDDDDRVKKLATTQNFKIEPKRSSSRPKSAMKNCTEASLSAISTTRDELMKKFIDQETNTPPASLKMDIGVETDNATSEEKKSKFEIHSSRISDTSEDHEATEEIVEASIHEPPKKFQKHQTQEATKTNSNDQEVIAEIKEEQPILREGIAELESEALKNETAEAIRSARTETSDDGKIEGLGNGRSDSSEKKKSEDFEKERTRDSPENIEIDSSTQKESEDSEERKTEDSQNRETGTLGDVENEYSRHKNTVDTRKRKTENETEETHKSGEEGKLEHSKSNSSIQINGGNLTELKLNINHEMSLKVVGTEQDNEEKTDETAKTEEQLQSSPKETNEFDSTLEDTSTTSSTKNYSKNKTHKSFKVLDDESITKTEVPKSKSRKPRSKSEETESNKLNVKLSKIPILKSNLSKSDRGLHQIENQEALLPSRRSKSTMSARKPGIEGNETISDENEDEDEDDLDQGQIQKTSRKRKVKRKSQRRDSRSAGSDYENLIDSGFEPSPRSTKLPKSKWKNMSDRGVNMSSVTQTIQSNIRRYHLERKIFQHLLDLKRLQIRSGQHNEAMMVKRAIDSYHNSCASTVGAGRYISSDLTFKSFESFLYESLRKLQKYDNDYLRNLPEAPTNPLLCTRSTHRCNHATHAYTGVPCAAYLPKLDHHSIPKIGFNDCKPSGFLPNISSTKNKNGVTLELCHGNEKQVISLPADRLDHNKRYYVTFTVKGNENCKSAKVTDHGDNENSQRQQSHRHARSD